MGIGRPARHPTRSKRQLSAVTPPLTHAAERGSRRDLYRLVCSSARTASTLCFLARAGPRAARHAAPRSHLASL